MRLVNFKTLSLLTLILASSVFLLTFKNTPQQNQEPQKVLGQEIKSSLNINGYEVSWFQAEPDKLNLISNFKEKQNANNLFAENNCKLAANAGFYSIENKALGYFVNNYEVNYEFKPNKIMNGILSVNSLNTPRITREVTSDSPRIAVQTGPMLIENDFDLKAKLVKDKNARRMVAAVTGENKLYFLSIYNSESVFLGPEISELAEILIKFEELQDINIADAINLDGGKASYFNNGETVLTEISPIGALFCQK